jgi:hypothetical protein
VTLSRTGAIALGVGALVARPWGGGAWLARCGLAALLMLWPALGGHFVEVWFLNRLRPRISPARGAQVATRLVIWFIGGAALSLGMAATAAALGVRRSPSTWAQLGWIGGLGLIGIELIAHLVLWARGRRNFYDGRG